MQSELMFDASYYLAFYLFGLASGVFVTWLETRR